MPNKMTTARPAPQRIEDRRKHPRYDLVLSGTAELLPDGRTGDRAGRPFGMSTVNVSASGLLMVCFIEAIRPGDRVRLKLNPKTASRNESLEIEGAIVWVRPVPTGRKGYEAGLAFTRTGSDTIRAILSLCDRRRSTASVVARQINLPFSRAVHIALRSLSIRFWKSLVTSAVVFLAIAFLAYMLAMQDIAAQQLSDQAKLEKVTATIQQEMAKASIQRIWITIIASLVAVLGIMNNLTMSVAERYREIGTMKCLGALNRFVVELFLLEALAIGVIGSTAGSTSGVFLAILLKGREFKDVVLPWNTIGADILIGCVAGMALTLLGAILPAYKAAQMHPAEAMRTEV